ncbi:MAG: endonuclease VII domain-containing protein [Actinobacteria bacterium]|nr:endonuclease VII domain-containing protein [Actinomycetota bacterium]
MAKRSPEYQAQLYRRSLLARYGLTEEMYAALLAVQDNVCAICKQQCPSGRALAIDHDHETKVVRGLLCCNCNHGLGQFKDEPALLQTAIDYLEASRCAAP